MLPYTENEICIMYRNAKDKKQQLQILADMNLTDRATIKEVLEKHGYKVDFAPKAKPRTGGLSREERAKRIELCKYYSEQGFTAKQAAEEMGIDNCDWLRRWALQYGITFAYSHKKDAQRFAKPAPAAKEIIDPFKKYKDAEQAGLTIEEAAQRIGVTANHVRKYAKKYGLEFAKQQKKAAR